MEIKFKNNDGEISEEICELVETDGDVCRIKRPSGEMIRIFKDRVFPVDEMKTESNEKKEEKDDSEEDIAFDPWGDLPDDGEVWVKSNSFNDTTICETIAVILPGENVYRSINTYNGVAKKIMEYPIKNASNLRNRMLRKGYERQERP